MAHWTRKRLFPSWRWCWKGLALIVVASYSGSCSTFANPWNGTRVRGHSPETVHPLRGLRRAKKGHDKKGSSKKASTVRTFIILQRILLLLCMFSPVVFFVAYCKPPEVVEQVPGKDVCHVSPNETAVFYTKTIAETQVEAYLQEGGLLGECSNHCDVLCDDGNMCTRDHVPGYDCEASGCPLTRPTMDCDDQNDWTVDSCDDSVGCVHECTSLPRLCSLAQPSASSRTSLKAEPCAFALSAPQDEEINARRQLIKDLVSRSNGRYTVEMILSNQLNRKSNPGISAMHTVRMTTHAVSGFRFNSGDEKVSYWYPQGISGTWDATMDRRVGCNGMTREAMLVSWYHKTSGRPTKGARVSLMDTTYPESVRYRHMLLVEPYNDTETGPNYRPVWSEKDNDEDNALHAGGIVWWGDLLYVADTYGGLRVFDLASIMRIHDSDKSEIGVSGKGFSAHGYKFIVPEIARYKLDEASCPVRFSFVSLDRSSDPPALVTGEYKEDSLDGRILVWSLDPATGFIDVPTSGPIRPEATYVGGHSKMQGATRYDGLFYISSSRQNGKFGTLYRTNLGHVSSTDTEWVYGAEDLYITRGKHLIWTVAEHPGYRDVLGIPMSGIPKTLPCGDAKKCR